jgi:hypothetical protein
MLVLPAGKLCLANSNLLRKFRGFLSRSTMSNARFAHSRCPYHRDGFSTCAAWRATHIVAESVLTKHQMLILNRSRRRAPNLRIQDRLIAGFCSLWIKPSRLRKVALAFKTSTLLSFHRALVQRKYRLLFFAKQRTKPGPKGPAADLIRAVVEMKKAQSDLGMSPDCRSDQPSFRNIYK